MWTYSEFKELFQPDGVFRTKRKSVLSNLFKSKQLKPNNSILHAFNKQNFTYVLKPLLKNAQQEIICVKTLESKINISCKLQNTWVLKGSELEKNTHLFC